MNFLLYRIQFIVHIHSSVILQIGSICMTFLT